MNLMTKNTTSQARRPAGLLNWKAALPVLGLALACLSAHPGVAAADETADKPAKAESGPRGCSKPAWPTGALEAKQGGTTTLALLIGADGKVEQSKITKSSGYDELDQAARVGIAKCTFDAGKKDGKPVSAWMQMQYVWTPEQEIHPL